jgi:hypothetical protein
LILAKSIILSSCNLNSELRGIDGYWLFAFGYWQKDTKSQQTQAKSQKCTILYLS